MPWVVVFDTNMLVASLLSLDGSPFRCLALAKRGTVQSVTCAEILAEFAEVLQRKFSYTPEQARSAADQVSKCSRLVTITSRLKVIAADPDDDKILECAVVGGADYIVSGDRRHVLPLGGYEGIIILKAADLLARIATS